MGIYQGDYLEDATVYIPLNSFTSDDPSASSTITNFVNTDIHIHKNNDTSQRNNAAGITVSLNFDGITGNHMVIIDTNDDTVAAFWVTGADYLVRVEGATIDGATINAWIGHFSIENRYNPVTDYDGPTKAEMDTAHALLATSAKLTKYVQLLARSDSAIETDNVTELTAINADGGSGAGDFSSQADSEEALQALIAAIQTDLGNFSGRTNDQTLLDVLGVPDVAGKDLHTLLVTDRLDQATYGLSALRTRGDAAWITGGGGSAADTAAAVWNALKSAHTSAGSMGVVLDHSHYPNDG